VRLFNINGKLVKKNVSKYLINWDKKSRSNIQFSTKQFLRNYWFSHIVYEEFPVYGSLLKVDFLNATKKIAIEVQGSQHESFNKFFHDNSRLKYLNSIKRDYNKFLWLEKNGFKLIEIYEKDVKGGLSLEFFQKTLNINIV
jgi:very-short-patch-repair endonuclease